jgi:hypothetical protein
MVTRLCAIGAIRKRTWAGMRVYDSSSTPLANALEVGGDPMPYIVFYTDSDNRGAIDGTDVFSASRSLALTMEIAVATAVEGKGPGGKEIRVPNTDEGVEQSVDITDSMAMRALFDPENPWSQLLLRIITNIERMPSSRGGRAERGARWAARQVSFVCNTLADAPAGVALGPNHVIRDFVTLALAHPDIGLTKPASVIADLISGGPYPPWEQAQSWLNVTRPTLRRIGLAPLVHDDAGVVIVSERGEDLVRPPAENRVAPVLDELELNDDDSQTSGRINYIPDPP